MKEIRRAFHDIFNHLNCISVKSGIAREMSKLKNIDSMDGEEIKAELKETLEILSLVEKAAVDAGKAVSGLKKKVYELLKIDTNKPLD